MNPLFPVVVWLSFLIASSNSQSGDEDSIRLFYYPDSRDSSVRLELDLNDLITFEAPNLDRNRRAKIHVHGGNGKCASDTFPVSSIDAYLRAKEAKREDWNVFCLDYEEVAQIKIPLRPIPGNQNPTLRESFEYVVNLVGNKTARFLLALEQKGIVPGIDQVHLIGHSLGGHVVGVTGFKLQEMTNFEKKIGRITGLDVFNVHSILLNVYQDELNLANQLDPSDASFVDILHTSDGKAGLKGDYGKIDFYPDGGKIQRSCLQGNEFANWWERATGACSHVIVGKYWARSIDGPSVTSCKANSYEDFQRKQNESICNDGIVFGEYVSQSAYGKFYMDFPIVENIAAAAEPQSELQLI